MIALLFGLLAVLDPISSHALELEDLKTQVVKIQSRAQAFPKKTLRGSGLLFLSDIGTVRVLTSDHLLFHANSAEGVEHLIEIPALKLKNPAIHVASDWGRGLAVLELPGFDPKLPRLMQRELEGPSEWTAGTAAITAGYPLDSASLAVDAKGTLSNASASYVFFAEPFPLLELEGAHGEFGMSGGAVFSRPTAGGLRFEGILSHQIPKTRTVAAIPREVAAKWLNDLTSDPALFEDFRMQGSGEPQAWAGMFRISLLSPGTFRRLHPEALIGAQAKNIPSLPESIDPGAAFGRYLEETRVRDFFPGARLVFFRTRPRDGRIQGGAPVHFETLPEMFRLLRNPALEAIFVMDTNQQDPHSNTHPSALGQLSTDLSFTFPSGFDSEEFEKTNLHSQLRLVVELLKAPAGIQNGHTEWARVHWRDIELIVDSPDYASAWALFQAIDQANAEKALATLWKIRDELYPLMF